MLKKQAARIREIDSMYQKITEQVTIPEIQQRPPETSLKILRPMAFYIRDQYGRPTLDRLCGEDIDAVKLLSGTSWIPQKTFDRFLKDLMALVGGDIEEFKRASVYRLSDALGSAKYLLWATSPKDVFRQVIRTFDYITTTVKRIQIIRESDTSMLLRYTTFEPESEESKITRYAQMEVMPTMWGLPPAEFTMTEIDPLTTEYEIIWTDTHSRAPILLGTLLGAAASLAVLLLMGYTLWPLSLTVLGFMSGYVVYTHRIHTAGLEYYGKRINTASKKELEIIPVIGILRRMGALSDKELDSLLSTGIVSGEHVIDLLLDKGMVQKADVDRAIYLHERIKMGNSKAIEALYEAFSESVRRSQAQVEAVKTQS